MTSERTKDVTTQRPVTREEAREVAKASRVSADKKLARAIRAVRKREHDKAIEHIRRARALFDFAERLREHFEDPIEETRQ